MDTTSASLLERLRHPLDQQTNWRRFVQLYTPLLYYWARQLGLEANDAADLVQEVFTVLVQKLPSFAYDRGKSFRGWLRTITVNKWREKRRRHTVEAGAPRFADVQDVAEPDSVAAFAEAEYQRHLVGRALELMQSEFQATTWQACWRCVVLEQPPATVASELGITVNAVYLAKSRVLRRLHQELHGLLD